LIWAAWQHRYRLIVWFAGTAVLLLAVSLALIPGWAAGFLYAVRRYADLMPFRSPIAVLASLCGESGAWLQAALTAGFIILTGWSWKKDIRTGVVPIGAVGVSLVTTTLAVPRLSPINHIVLLVPLAAGLSEWWRRKGLCRLASTVLGVLAVAAPWAIAPLTGNAVEGDSWQYGVLVFVLPVLSLVVSTAESVKPARSRCRVGAGGKGGGSEK